MSFHHENKPAFRPFVLNAIDLDVNTTPTAPMSLDDLPIPAHMISDQLLAELTDAVGAGNPVQDDLDRIVHTYGKSARDLLRIRAGDIPRVPDVVVYPGDEAEVQLIVDRAVAADAVIIPYGGGSSFSGSLHAPEDETRPLISVDLGRLNQVIDGQGAAASAVAVHLNGSERTRDGARLRGPCKRSPPAMRIHRSPATDPGRNFNPGKIIPK